MVKKSKKWLFLKKIFWIGLFAFFVVVGLLAIWTTTLNLPKLENFEERKVAQSTKIYDRTGEILLFDVHGEIKRTVVSLDQISDYVEKATIAAEDKNFYSHNGIEPMAIIRAVFKNLASGNLLSGQGGSTITQQVLKNALLTTDKKISRKIKEWVLAPRLENILTKDEILAIYLNEVPYGGNVYGIQEASLRFFGKEAKDLNLTESAYLAALPQAPTYYSPYGNNLDDLENRKNYVLDQMVEAGFIGKEEADNAKKTKVAFEKQEEFGIKSPHFVMYVREILEKEYGKDVIEEGGLRVTTSLDWEMQQVAEEIVLKHSLENEKKFNAENGAMISVDPKNGEVLVMVGSRNYFDEKIDGNFNIITSERQPGSVFKPIVYSEAFTKGYRPETIVFDLETEFSTSCEDDPKTCYKPQNYDGVFRGPVSLRNALAQSINIPAVKVLYLAGLRDSLVLAKKMGLETLTNVDQYGLTLVLGGGEVKPLDVAKAYSVFATEGIKTELAPILKIENASGEVLFDIKNENQNLRSERVLDESVARDINDILTDNEARTPAFGSSSYLYFPENDVAVKTGTTNDYKDAWIVGYTPNLTTVAWAGNNDNSPMEKKVAGFIVAPMWNEFMRFALEKRDSEYFNDPDPKNLDVKPIIVGFWKGEEIKSVKNNEEERIVVTGGGNGIHSILHWVDKNNPLGPIPTNPNNDSQYEQWEKSVQEWVKKQKISDKVKIQDLNKEKDVVLEIISLNEDVEYLKNEYIAVVVKISDNRKIDRGEVYLNEKKLGDLDKEGVSLAFIPEKIDSIKKENKLNVVVVDELGNKFKKEIVLKIKD